MREEAGGWVYLLASKRYGTLYTGSTTNLIARIRQHREGELRGFTRKHNVKRLIWFEAHDSVASAYRREQSIKRWLRDWKIALIEEKNPNWEDLYPSLIGLPATHALTLPGRMPRESGAESRDPSMRQAL